MNNLKIPEIRNEIKRREKAELNDPNLPRHRREEVEAMLYLIEAYEREEEVIRSEKIQSNNLL